MTDLTGVTGYKYDDLSRLTQVKYPGPKGTTKYGYDEVGNRQGMEEKGSSQSIGYDGGNQITNGYSETYTHDYAGNLETRVKDGKTATYHWDALNRLTKVDLPGGGNVQYVYNGDNQRVKKIGPSGTVNYIFDGLSVILEKDGDGNATNKYVPGISVTDAAGTKMFYLHDGLGSVMNLTDKSGNVVEKYEYDAFGQTRGSARVGGNRFVGGAGVVADDDTGLHYMWNRWYDAKLGRFISRDPIGYAGGINMYSYVENDPVDFLDRYGLCSQTQWDKVIGSLSGLGKELNGIYKGQRGNTARQLNKAFGLDGRHTTVPGAGAIGRVASPIAAFNSMIEPAEAIVATSMTANSFSERVEKSAKILAISLGTEMGAAEFSVPLATRGAALGFSKMGLPGAVFGGFVGFVTPTLFFGSVQTRAIDSVLTSP